MPKNSVASYEFEEELHNAGITNVVGIDEAGRGALCGCVVAAAVIVPPEAVGDLLGEVKDSKKLTPKKREKLFDIITSTCYYAIDEVDNTLIDEMNILEATKVAMTNCVYKLPTAEYALIDGNMSFKSLPIPYRSLVGGDALSISIAAASILAKVYRDSLMISLDNVYPGYGLAKHKGYGTKEHREAIKRLGPSPIHRLSFGCVK